jgi:hypothetical protein
MRLAGLVLAVAGAVVGFAIAFGAWGVGYCGGLTPDIARPGTLRADLCRGTSGEAASAVVLACWLLAAVAPLIGLRWALRRQATGPLVAATVVGALPISIVVVLSATLPGS